MARKKISLSSVAIILIVLGVFIFLCLAYFRINKYLTNRNDREVFEYVNKTSVPLHSEWHPTPEPTPTAADEGIDSKNPGWKTFTFRTLSFDLPEGWKGYSNGDTNDYENYDPNVAPGRSFDPAVDKGMYKLEIRLMEIDADFDTYIHGEVPHLDVPLLPDIAEGKGTIHIYNNVRALEINENITLIEVPGKNEVFVVSIYNSPENNVLKKEILQSLNLQG